MSYDYRFAKRLKELSSSKQSMITIGKVEQTEPKVIISSYDGEIVFAIDELIVTETARSKQYHKDDHVLLIGNPPKVLIDKV